MNAKRGNDGSLPAKPKTTSKTTNPTPSAAANERITVPIRTSGATSARSRTIRIRKTTASAIGGISFESWAAATRRSRSIAVGPPISTSSPTGLLGDRAQLRDPVVGRGRVGIVGERDLDQLARAGRCRRWRTSSTASWLGERLRDRRRFLRVGDDRVGRGAGSGRERLGEQVLAADRLDVVAEAARLGQAGVEVEPAERQQQQDHDRPDPDPARAARDPSRRSAARPVRLVGLVIADVGDERPERPAARDHEHRRQQRQHRDHRDRDAGRADRPEARRCPRRRPASGRAGPRSPSAPRR